MWTAWTYLPCTEAVRKAKAYVRTKGPLLLVAQTYRFLGHSRSDANAIPHRGGDRPLEAPGPDRPVPGSGSWRAATFRQSALRTWRTPCGRRSRPRSGSPGPARIPDSRCS
ncbi:MAG: thiamine pyrophosphate-dependent enzyme [Candidatus Moduliflexus flocculans]|nr:thiamine pyrophosphate-dependent enzyme [Candidatus Moduliflexus flocculans]